MWFNKKLKLTDRETQFESCVLKLLAQKETIKKLKIETTETTCLLKNEEKHIQIKIDSIGITIQNSIFSTKERLRDKVTSHLKEIIIKNMNQETEEELLEMDRKEEELLERINNLI